MKEKQKYSTVVQTNAVSINFNILCGSKSSPLWNCYEITYMKMAWDKKWKMLKIKEESLKGGMKAERLGMENNEDKIKNCLCIAIWLSQKLELRSLLQTEITYNSRPSFLPPLGVCCLSLLLCKLNHPYQPVLYGVI